MRDKVLEWWTRLYHIAQKVEDSEVLRECSPHSMTGSACRASSGGQRIATLHCWARTLDFGKLQVTLCSYTRYYALCFDSARSRFVRDPRSKKPPPPRAWLASLLLLLLHTHASGVRLSLPTPPANTPPPIPARPPPPRRPSTHSGHKPGHTSRHPTAAA